MFNNENAMTKMKKLLLFLAVLAMNISFAFAQLGPLPGDPLPGDPDPDPGIEVPLDESALMGLLGLSALGVVLFIRKKNKRKGDSQNFSKED
jgi:LPXTG-motif cell wall-anchored protein